MSICCVAEISTRVLNSYLKPVQSHTIRGDTPIAPVHAQFQLGDVNKWQVHKVSQALLAFSLIQM